MKLLFINHSQNAAFFQINFNYKGVNFIMDLQSKNERMFNFFSTSKNIAMLWAYAEKRSLKGNNTTLTYQIDRVYQDFSFLSEKGVELSFKADYQVGTIEAAVAYVLSSTGKKEKWYNQHPHIDFNEDE